MKKILSSLFLLLTFIACSEPEPDLQLSNPEAFAFDLGDSWEVNASVTSVGFQQIEKDVNHNIELSYSVDIVTPNADSLVSIYSDTIKESDSEEFMDFILEAQIEIETTFGEGDYKLYFHVTDDLSKQTKTIFVAFNLTK